MMKTNLVVHNEPDKFNDLLNEFIKKAYTEGYHVRSIEYAATTDKYSALLILVKLNK